MKKHHFEVEIYLYGSSKKIEVITKESKEELEENYELLQKYVEKEVLNSLSFDLIKEYDDIW